jgi:cyclic beta-1,2-glucan synthetase
MHHLSNPDPEAQFALLTDFADSPAAATARDDALLAAARHAIEGLNARLSGPDHARFLLLHRRARERARRLLDGMGAQARQAGGARTPPRGEATVSFAPLGALSVPRPRIRYVLTLDSDTVTGPRAVRELVAIASHPLNAAIRAAGRRRIAAGYGILQPRVVPPLPTPGERTPYHWLFAGQCGIDPYSATTSEIYQDSLRHRSFTGKGLLDVAVMHDTLDRRVPDDTLLSHDLFEGSIARCGFVSDVILMEDAPSHAEVAAARLHRWTRATGSFCPFLFRARRYDLDALAQWKIADNLRRSLIAPASLAALCVALVTGVPPVAHALAVVVAAFATGPCWARSRASRRAATASRCRTSSAWRCATSRGRSAARCGNARCSATRRGS